jgi:trehalose 6-phosphate synthase
MAALFQAADVMLVTPLRDGMNLVAKEYVTCRHDLGGALVLSEFTGAWHELHQAFACNPHDIEGLKQTILRAINTPEKDKQRIMKALRRRVSDHDVQRWAARYLAALAVAPELPGAEARPQPTPLAEEPPLMPAPSESRSESRGESRNESRGVADRAGS